jgi:hypothetical protein
MGLIQWLFGIKPVTFEGGTGETCELAVVLRGARGAMRGIPAEYRYLTQRLGQRGVDWQLVEQRLFEVDGKHYDHFRLALKDGREVEVYFDISEFYGRVFF